jgi:hypothetical protein
METKKLEFRLMFILGALIGLNALVIMAVIG